jgi:hypothetical protein
MTGVQVGGKRFASQVGIEFRLPEFLGDLSVIVIDINALREWSPLLT